MIWTYNGGMLYSIVLVFFCISTEALSNPIGVKMCQRFCEKRHGCIEVFYSSRTLTCWFQRGVSDGQELMLLKHRICGKRKCRKGEVCLLTKTSGWACVPMYLNEDHMKGEANISPSTPMTTSTKRPLSCGERMHEFKVIRASCYGNKEYRQDFLKYDFRKCVCRALCQGQKPITVRLRQRVIDDCGCGLSPYPTSGIRRCSYTG